MKKYGIDHKIDTVPQLETNRFDRSWLLRLMRPPRVGSGNGSACLVCQRLQVFGVVVAQVHVHGTAPTACQRAEVTESFCALDIAQREILVRNLDIVRLVAADNQEHALVRATFVQLTRGVQVARPNF